MKLLQGIDIPPGLDDLFEKETALSMVRDNILDAMKVLESDIATIGNRRRWSRIFTSRAALQRKKDPAQSDMEVLRIGLDKLLAAETSLVSYIDYMLENHLRRNDSNYVIKLAAHNYPADWERFAHRFDFRMQAMQQLVAVFRTKVASLKAEAHVGADPSLTVDIQAMKGCATALDEEIAFFTLLADPQGGMTRPSSLTNSGIGGSLPGWRALVDQITELTASEVFSLLTTAGSKLTASSLLVTSEIKLRCQLAKQHTNDLPSYHQQVLSASRLTARLRFMPERLTQIVTTTELMIQSGALWMIQAPAEETSRQTLAAPRRLQINTKIGNGNPPEPWSPFIDGRQATAPVQPVTMMADDLGPSPSRKKISMPPSSKNESKVIAHSAPLSVPEALPPEALAERESYLIAVESKLMEKMELHQEKEAELAQRESDLWALERELMALKSSLLGVPPAPVKPPDKFDEFND